MKVRKTMFIKVVRHKRALNVKACLHGTQKKVVGVGMVADAGDAVFLGEA